MKVNPIFRLWVSVCFVKFYVFWLENKFYIIFIGAPVDPGQCDAEAMPTSDGDCNVEDCPEASGESEENVPEYTDSAEGKTCVNHT